MPGTLAALHRSLGVVLPSPEPPKPPTPRLQLAKVTGENLSAVLTSESFAAIERELRSRPCLHAQLTVASPMPFPLLQCSVEYTPAASEAADSRRPPFVGTAHLRPVGR